MNIIETIVSALTEMLTGSTEAITTGVQNLFTDIVVDAQGNETQVLSTLGVIMFTLLGLGFAVGLVYVIINLVRR